MCLTEGHICITQAAIARVAGKHPCRIHPLCWKPENLHPPGLRQALLDTLMEGA